MKKLLIVSLGVMLTGCGKREAVHQPHNGTHVDSSQQPSAVPSQSREPFQQDKNESVGQLRAKARSDKELIQGIWQPVSWRIGKSTVNPKPHQKIFEGDKVTFKETRRKISKQEFKYRLDPTKKPKHIDFFLARDGNTWIAKSIYLLEGDKLTICGGKQPNQRPTRFSSEDGKELIVFERVKYNTAEQEAIVEIQKLGGRVVKVDKKGPHWAVISILLGGSHLTDAGLLHLKVQLKALTKLQTLILDNTHVTDAGVKDLKKALPKVDIRR